MHNNVQGYPYTCILQAPAISADLLRLLQQVCHTCQAVGNTTGRQETAQQHTLASMFSECIESAGSGQGKGKGQVGPSEQHQKAGKAPSALEAALQCEEDLADDAAASPGLVTLLQHEETDLLKAQRFQCEIPCGMQVL